MIITISTMIHETQTSPTKPQITKLYLLAYSSKIGSSLLHDPVRLNATTTQILGQANKNNSGQQLTGVLYCGQGHFFQCIEGDETTVNNLFQKIKKDHRHEAVKLLVTTQIKQRYFKTWCMKFVNTNRKINDYFERLGLASFTPEKLNKKQLVGLLRLLQNE